MCVRDHWRKPRWNWMFSFIQVEPILWSVAVATFQRAYRDSKRGLSVLKLYYRRVKTYLFSCWGHYGLKPEVQPFYSKALICLPPVHLLLHLFWHDRELLSQARDELHTQVKAPAQAREPCPACARSEGWCGLECISVWFIRRSTSLDRKLQTFHSHPDHEEK